MGGASVHGKPKRDDTEQEQEHLQTEKKEQSVSVNFEEYNGNGGEIRDNQVLAKPQHKKVLIMQIQRVFISKRERREHLMDLRNLELHDENGWKKHFQAQSFT
ncbi:hypothetical protein CAEBREN_04690 [Caenorhabditis brenneri]|uniref:Uncharacterized protein n=1 Tax=Caenorhabditis brenneri TaxID=135651 RepID=G0P4Q2_CAEBE|nr:hypothetical protein CAEBREN_04690 [Caenorhabditis brenneri]